MKVCVSVLGKFHAFELAKQLYRHGALHRLFTSYPRFRMQNLGLPDHAMRHTPVAEGINRLFSRLPVSEKWRQAGPVLGALYFDRRVASRLPDETDIFVGWSGSSLLSLRAAKQRGAVTIIERHNAHILLQEKILTEEYAKQGFEFEGIPKTILRRELQEYEEADYLSVPSTFVHRTMIQMGVPASKLILNPLGADTLDFYPGTKTDSTFRVVCCGQISIRKGIPYVLRAFSQLSLANSELILVGALSPEMRAILRKGSFPKVKVIPPQPQNELRKLFVQSSVLCLASVEDGFGLVVPQALASGLPVLATTRSCGEDLIRDGIDGFVIPPADVDALKEKLLWLFKNKVALEQMRTSAAERVATGFSWKDYGERMLHAYSHALSSATAARQREKFAQFSPRLSHADQPQ